MRKQEINQKNTMKSKEMARKMKKDKEKPEYEMPKKEAIAEHKRLLPILKKASPSEYKKQKSELSKIKHNKD